MKRMPRLIAVVCVLLFVSSANDLFAHKSNVDEVVKKHLESLGASIAQMKSVAD